MGININAHISGSHFSLAGAWRLATKAVNIFAEARQDLLVEFDVGDFEFPGHGSYRNLSKWRDASELKMLVKTKKNDVLTQEEVAQERGVQNGFCVR